jgi:hypothetical protein
MLKRFMSATHSNLDFLRSRIYEIKSALFSDSDKLSFKIPTCIISVLKVDHNGDLWFLMNQPEYHMSCYGHSFPASLSFYRKGVNFSLNVQGMAAVVFDCERVQEITGLSEAEQQATMNNILLIKVNMKRVNYCEWTVKPPRAKGFEKIFATLAKILFYPDDGGYRQREYQMG